MRNILKSFIVIPTILALSSCSAGKKAESTLYTLKLDSGAISSQTCNAKLSVQVIEPVSASGLESRRIAIYQKNNQMNYYKGVRWAAPVSEMFRNLMVDGLDQSGVFASVGTDMDAIAPDYILVTDIRDFQLDDSGSTPYAHIRVVTKLIDTRTHKIIITIPSEQNIQPSAQKMDNIIAAFDYGSAIAVGDVIAKLPATISACNQKPKK